MYPVTSTKCCPKSRVLLVCSVAEKLLNAGDVGCVELSLTAEMCLDAGAPSQGLVLVSVML
jgi:hypothetical protein